MAVKQTVYLISEQQRDALIGYLQNRPFREVRSAIQFLSNAPSAILNMVEPEEQSTSMPAEQEPKQEEDSSTEELALLGRV